MKLNAEKTASVSTARKGRNPSFEYCRVLASIAVIFGHCNFPGVLGMITDGFARITVPFFFAVSGYFAYRANETKIKKRLKGVAKLNLWATLIYVVWGSYLQKNIYHAGRLPWLADKLALRRLVRWVVVSWNPFAEHLWYLAAILVCYFLVYLYIQWWGKSQNYYPLYIVGICMYAVHVATSSLATAVSLGVPDRLYRNALFYGLPMFSMGVFIREYQDRIIETYQLSRRKMVAIVLSGAVLNMLQTQGTGLVAMPIGSVFAVIALMLLLGSARAVAPGNRILSAMVSRLGELSLVIYVIHPFWIDIYTLFVQERITGLGETAGAYLGPIVVILISVLTGVVWIAAKEIIRQMVAGIHATLSRGK